MKKYEGVRFYGTPEHDEATVEEGVEIGEGTKIGQNTYIGKNAKIGRNCSILYHVTICKDTIIGDGVFIGPNTSFFNDKYPPTTVSTAPTVEDHVVICGSSNIGPGIRIHRRAVIGMGTNVTKDIPGGQVWVGNPAKFYMTRKEYDEKQKVHGWKHR